MKLTNRIKNSVRMLRYSMGAPTGCLDSPYDPRDHFVTLTGKTDPKDYPKNWHMQWQHPHYQQLVSNCVVQVARRILCMFFGEEFGVNLVYAMARAANQKGAKGTIPRVVLDFVCKYGMAPASVDTGEYEVPGVVDRVKGKEGYLMAAAAKYAGCTYAKLRTPNEVKAALLDGYGVMYKMTVSRNGLRIKFDSLKQKIYWFLGNGINGIGRHMMGIEGWGEFPVSSRSVEAGTDTANSWGDDWADCGRCHMTWDDVFHDDEVYAVMPPADLKPTDPHTVAHAPLRIRMKGDDVKHAQELLIKHGFAMEGGADGVFGMHTFNATMAFQKHRKIDADGIIGPVTWDALHSDPWPVEPKPEPVTERDKLLSRVFDAGAALIGTDYSQANRWDIFPGGEFDCSTFVKGVFAAAGVLLVDDKGAELMNSTTEVYAKDFQLMWPASYDLIGKTFGAKGLESICKPGDIICYNLQRTSRRNKITHIAVVDRNGNQIIQTANNKRKCERQPLNYYEGHVCAIIRLPVDYKRHALPLLTPGDRGATVRMLQVCLNIWHGERLTCDGIYGSKTSEAVAEVNTEAGSAGYNCTSVTWNALGL